MINISRKRGTNWNFVCEPEMERKHNVVLELALFGANFEQTSFTAQWTNKCNQIYKLVNYTIRFFQIGPGTLYEILLKASERPVVEKLASISSQSTV